MANHISIQRDRIKETVSMFPKKQQPFAEHLLLVLLLEANWQDGTISTDWEVIDIKRGEVPIGLEAMSDRLGCSFQTLRTILNRFKTNKLLTSRSTNRGTILNIVNYDGYTDYKNETNKQKKINQQITNNSKEVKTKEVPHPAESNLVTPSHQNPSDNALEAIRQINNVLGRTGIPIKKHRVEISEQVARIGMVGILNAIKHENTKREILNANDYWSYVLAIIARFDPTEASHQKTKEKVWTPPDSDQLEERRKEMAKRGINFLESTVTETRKLDKNV